jgi:hypothetical protein
VSRRRQVYSGWSCSKLFNGTGLCLFERSFARSSCFSSVCCEVLRKDLLYESWKVSYIHPLYMEESLNIDGIPAKIFVRVFPSKTYRVLDLCQYHACTFCQTRSGTLSAPRPLIYSSDLLRSYVTLGCARNSNVPKVRFIKLVKQIKASAKMVPWVNNVNT